ncbi:hypothetical protein ACE1TH_09480 [Shouchella sp. JSM 1781072]|uniref:hypothetical protein n=1 Tax=Bacillaceae TaxID=186817 RepID=UPI00159BAA90|nr:MULTISPECIES: hypothetical protein [Bacillaceae]UTR07404.1 hypothetical protein MM326_05055 [Alkalihalobacillus sp. LMS6]
MNGSLIGSMVVGVLLGFIAAGSLGAIIGLCAGILFQIANELESIRKLIKKRSE